MQTMDSYVLLWILVLSAIFHSKEVHSTTSVGDLEGAVRERVAAARRALTPLADDALDQLAAMYLPVDAEDESCRLHSTMTLDSYRRAEHWATDMVEASTFPLLHGISVEPGRHRQCLSASEPHQLFTGQMCMVDASGVYPAELMPYLDWGLEKDEMIRLLGGPVKGFMFAVCVPSSCSPVDVNRRINASLAKINASSEICPEGCSNAQGRSFHRLDWAALCIFGGIGLLVVFSTWRDKQYRNAEFKSKLLEVFALQGNWARLTSTSRPSNSELGCLDGLRVLCIICVIAYHRPFFSFAVSITHYAHVVEYVEGYGAAVLEVVSRCIDVFLVIGSFLRAHTFFQSQRKGKPLNVTQSILLRYFRYTPALAAVVLFNASLLCHLSTGSMWLWDCKMLSASCKYFWFLPILHIGNYIFPTGCVSTSWYLAADFHLFIVSLLVLIPLHRWPRLGFLILTLGILLSLGHYFYSTYTTATIGGNIFIDRVRKVHIDTQHYMCTHIRVSTYFLGLALGYVVLKLKDKRSNKFLTKAQVRLGWVACVLYLLGHFCAALFVLRPDRPFSLLDPLYITLTKFMAGVAACWLILVCTTGQGGAVNRFLSWPGFMPLSKLTVGIILCNQQLLQLHLMRNQGPFRLDYFDLIILAFGDLCICSIISVVLYLTIESPCYRLAEHFLRPVISSTTKITDTDIDNKLKSPIESVKNKNKKQTPSVPNQRRHTIVGDKPKKQ